MCVIESYNFNEFGALREPGVSFRYNVTVTKDAPSGQCLPASYNGNLEEGRPIALREDVDIKKFFKCE